MSCERVIWGWKQLGISKRKDNKTVSKSKICFNDTSKGNKVNANIKENTN